MKTIIVEGHRGYCAKYPENTLISFAAAMDLGVDAFEFDVWLTSDKVPVLMHDGNARRTCGVDRHLRDMTLAEAKQLDACYAEKFGDTFRGQGITVPTLEETLQLAAEKRHQQAAGDAQRQEDAPGGGIDPANLVVMAQRGSLRDHPAHGDRKAGGGDHQQNIVDLVGSVEIAEALFTDDGIEGDLIQGADDFDNGSGHGKQGSTLEKILLLFGIGHRIPPYFASSNRRGMA